MHVERVKGNYIEPEIIDLEDGSGCLFRLHETDVHKDGPKLLSELLTDQAQRWAPRPPGSPLGHVIPVRWLRTAKVVDLDRFVIGVDDGADSITYKVDPELISQRAADFLGHELTKRSPCWQRVSTGYHDVGGADAGE